MLQHLYDWLINAPPRKPPRPREECFPVDPKDPILQAASVPLRRDLDVCRRILVEMASWQTSNVPIILTLEGVPREVVAFNVNLLAEDELLRAVDMSRFGDAIRNLRPMTLTPKGEDMLSLAWDDERWIAVVSQLPAGAPLRVVARLLEYELMYECGGRPDPNETPAREGDVPCRAKREGWFCTRVKGHAGWHCAHVSEGRLERRWRNFGEDL